ncbi:hypothetical protein [Neolewinella agarilytica]|uniref:hypothetical protein n=1 Tax=Neolewinella agarilytica TaxID=478744 RepID=UPI0011143751|nr:hypothetical protein [Neolewinella agarilytica]
MKSLSYSQAVKIEGGSCAASIAGFYISMAGFLIAAPTAGLGTVILGGVGTMLSLYGAGASCS